MIITENSPTPILKDFDNFISYFACNKIKVSEKTEYFPGKALNEINAKLEKGIQNPPKNLKQEGYTLINLFYHISLVSGLADIAFVNNKSYFEVTPRYEDFSRLSPVEKYMFLLEAFWGYCDLSDISIGNSKSRIAQEIILFLDSVYKDIEKGELVFYLHNRRYWYSFIYFGAFIECLSFFGFCVFEVDPDHERTTKSRKVIKQLSITDFGKIVLPILNRNRNLSYWNIAFRNECEERIDFPGQKLDNFNIGDFMFKTEKYSLTSGITEPEPFQNAFKSLLPGLKDITMPVAPPVKEIELSLMIFNIYFTNKIYRKIAISSDLTLEDLHLSIQDAFEFDNDHLYSFFMDGKPWSHKAINSPYGDEGPFTDEIILGDLRLKPGKKILYLFDYGDEWRFNVVLKKVDPIEKAPEAHIILESIGEAPEQYPDYEQDWE